MDSEEAIRDEAWPSVISIVFLGVLILPLLAIWASSLFIIRREDNPSTMASTYMKIVYPVAFLSFAFQFAHLALEIWMRRILLSHNSNEIPPDDVAHRMSYMSYRLDALSSTLLDIADIFLVLALFELGNGLLSRLTGKLSSLFLVLRYTLLLPSAIVLYLAIATHIRGYSTWSRSFSTDEDTEQRLQEAMEELEEWDTPLLALWWAASFLLFAYATFLWSKAKGNAPVVESTVTFLAATVLNLFNPVRQAVMTTLDLDSARFKLANRYLYLIDDILDYWVRFFIIALIFVMGIPNNKGLWSAISQLYSTPLETARPIKE
ncbi:hypothetical protein ACHAPT_003797 [Fusarium lateritium]